MEKYEQVGSSYSLVDKETEKYIAYWENKGQKSINDMSCEGRYTDVAYDILEMVPSDTMIDYGCGTGLCGTLFHDKGLDVTLLDITTAGLAEAVQNYNFVQAPLWDLPDDLIVSDWAYSADVLEHLPTSKVDIAVEQIAKHTKQGGWFKVGTQRETRNLIEGRRWHLTIKPPGWWLRTFEMQFRYVEMRLCYKPCNKQHPWGLPNYDGLEFAEGAVFICKT